MKPLPNNYPSSCSRKEIQEVINEFQKELTGHADKSYESDSGTPATLSMYASMIQLGQAEIGKKNTILAIKFSVIAIIIATFSLIMDYSYTPLAWPNICNTEYR